jgi:hypothetical protein
MIAWPVNGEDLNSVRRCALELKKDQAAKKDAVEEGTDWRCINRT